MKKVILTLLAIATIASCSDDDENVDINPNPVEDPVGSDDPNPSPNQVQVRTDATFGQVMTDADGFTLYFFAPDSDGNSRCLGGCRDAWPVFNPSELSLDSGLDAADFGTITRDDGAAQTTYKGWPLYRFANDPAAGDINGDGSGGVWFVAKPDYSVMITRAQLVGRDVDGNETNLTGNYEPGEEETFYMTSANGRTIYLFSNDSRDTNTFTNADFSNDGVWPILKRDIVNIPSIFDIADFGTIDVFGETQVTYKGWPLYYFGGDENRGDNFGVGFPAAGVWPIVNTDTEPAPEAPASTNQIQLRNDATFGQVLTNVDGFTLYFFAPDSKGDATCLDGCAGVWPAFNTDDLTLDGGLDAADFGSITRADGDNQITYKGWPLYLFSNDGAPGDINGDGAGGTWFVAKPDYSIMIARGQLVGRDADGIETNLTSDYEEGDGETFYMTNASGRTIYHFSNDSRDTNTFTNEDFSNDGVWPILRIDITNIPSIFDAADFGTINVFGETQVTYKGWPLYYFGGDENRGDNFGVGFPAAGIWPIVNPDTENAPEAETQGGSYSVTNQGASAYIFNGEGLNNSSNPNFTLKRGETYEFSINTPGHPFFIKVAQTLGTGETFDDGVSNNGTSTGTVTFTVPANAPDTLFYICEFHSSMTGTFTIED